MTAKSMSPGRDVLEGTRLRPGVASPLVGRYNRGLVLETIRLHPGVSRVEVAAVTGLTTATVSNIVRGLLDEGVVVEEGAGESRGGKPRVRLKVRHGFRYAAGIHLRPHSLGVVLADLDGTVVSESTEAFARARSQPETILRQAAELVGRAQADADVSDEAMLGVGVACPGPIDIVRRAVLKAPHLPRWHDVPIADILEQHLHGPVTVENNANAAAIGDKWLGVARDLSTFLYVYLGIGVGGAIFVDHLLYRGVTGNAGAIGHISVDPQGQRCRCGNIGCLETVCSEQAMITRVVQAVGGVKARLGLTLTAATVDEDHRRILTAAAEGDPEITAAIEPALEQLGLAVASLVNVLDIGDVVVGGPAVVAAPELYLEAIRDKLSCRPIARGVQRIGVVHSDLGQIAATVGAASLIFHETYAPSLLTT